MSLPASVIAFKKTVLHPTHVTTYNQLAASAKTPAQVQSAEGESDPNRTIARLSILVDEGLAVQNRVGGNVNGATLSTYQLS